MNRRLALLLLVALGGCATPPAPRQDTRPGAAAPPAGPGSTAPGAAPAAPGTTPPRAAAPRPPSPLAGEQRWLGALFEGTPVRVTGESDGGVRVEVPLRFAYNAEATQAQPPLRAVVDKLAQSLQRQPTSRLVIAAPGPSASERGQGLRQQLVAHGVAAHRINAIAAASSADAVSLKLALAPSAISRLDDGTLPPPCLPGQAASSGANNGSCRDLGR